ncbi:MAG: hypothetical protein AAF499_04700, partial [Pseudomonadota bacterium]
MRTPHSRSVEDTLKLDALRQPRHILALASLAAPGLAAAVECAVPQRLSTASDYDPASLSQSELFTATADSLRGETQGVLTLEGNVRLQHRETLLNTDRAMVDTRTLNVSSAGATAIQTPNLFVSAENFDAQLDTDELNVTGA